MGIDNIFTTSTLMTGAAVHVSHKSFAALCDYLDCHNLVVVEMLVPHQPSVVVSMADGRPVDAAVIRELSYRFSRENYKNKQPGIGFDLEDGLTSRILKQRINAERLGTK